MGHLLTLDDRPQTWAELHQRNAAFYRRGWRATGPARRDRQIARRIHLTDKGREVLREMQVAS